jgi:hypothetical protein
MKQYDKVNVPIGSGGIMTETIDGPVVVLTIEELKEIWDKGYVRGCEEAEAKFHSYDGHLATKSFAQFIESKGLSI